jgi:uncharacterized protein
MIQPDCLILLIQRLITASINILTVMNYTINTISMKKIFKLFLLIPLVMNAQTGDKNFIDQNYIEVIAKSEINIIPDLIYLKIQLSEKDNKTPLLERESIMISKLKELGIDVVKDLATRDISSNFKYYLLTKNEILLTKEYQLLVRDSKTASRVIIELENIGISNVSIDKLDNSNIEQYRKDVKIDAIKAAKKKAEYLTDAIGQSIGRAIFVQELLNNSYNGGSPGSSNSIMIRGVSSNIYGSNASLPDIEFEKIKLEYSILCRFELK